MTAPSVQDAPTEPEKTSVDTSKAAAMHYNATTSGIVFFLALTLLCWSFVGSLNVPLAVGSVVLALIALTVGRVQSALLKRVLRRDGLQVRRQKQSPAVLGLAAAIIVGGIALSALGCLAGVTFLSVLAALPLTIFTAFGLIGIFAIAFEMIPSTSTIGVRPDGDDRLFVDA